MTYSPTYQESSFSEEDADFIFESLACNLEVEQNQFESSVEIVPATNSVTTVQLLSDLLLQMRAEGALNRLKFYADFLRKYNFALDEEHRVYFAREIILSLRDFYGLPAEGQTSGILNKKIQATSYLLLAAYLIKAQANDHDILQALTDSYYSDPDTVRFNVSNTLFETVFPKPPDYTGAIIVGVLLIATVVIAVVYLQMRHFANSAFENTWDRTDKVVADEKASPSRTWFWGENPEHDTTEPYAQAISGTRTVEYFQKGRMELAANGTVTNGHLPEELMLGEIQIGDTTYTTTTSTGQPVTPADFSAVGDDGDQSGPTYTALGKHMKDNPLAIGTVITTVIDHDGNVVSNPTLLANVPKVKVAYYVPVTKHSIAQPFWDFLQSTGQIYRSSSATTTVIGKLFDPTFFITGLPLTEAYWTQAIISDKPTYVLVQVFESRVLTYAPSNSVTWQVEMANTGDQYYNWRYSTN